MRRSTKPKILSNSDKKKKLQEIESAINLDKTIKQNLEEDIKLLEEEKSGIVLTIDWLNKDKTIIKAKVVSDKKKIVADIKKLNDEKLELTLNITKQTELHSNTSNEYAVKHNILDKEFDNMKKEIKNEELDIRKESDKLSKKNEKLIEDNTLLKRNNIILVSNNKQQEKQNDIYLEQENNNDKIVEDIKKNTIKNKKLTNKSKDIEDSISIKIKKEWELNKDLTKLFNKKDIAEKEVEELASHKSEYVRQKLLIKQEKEDLVSKENYIKQKYIDAGLSY